MLVWDVKEDRSSSDVGLETWSRSRDLSRPVFDGLGLGLGLEYAGLGLGLGLRPAGLGLGLGLGPSGLGLGLGLEHEDGNDTYFYFQCYNGPKLD
jgi:hypothetical protein